MIKMDKIYRYYFSRTVNQKEISEGIFSVYYSSRNLPNGEKISQHLYFSAAWTHSELMSTKVSMRAFVKHESCVDALY